MKFKVCGLTQLEQVKEINSLNFDYLGFIFYPKSKRCISEELLIGIKDLCLKKVAVFVNEEIEKIKYLVSIYNFSFIQLHGDETKFFCEDLKSRVNKIIIKAFQINQDFDFSILTDYQEAVDYFLFDTACDSYGGSGKVFNWEILKKYNLDTPYFLSGGLNPDNLNLALEFAKNDSRLFALDLNSGFEISPGKKNIDLLKGIINEKK